MGDISGMVAVSIGIRIDVLENVERAVVRLDGWRCDGGRAKLRTEELSQPIIQNTLNQINHA